MIAIQPPVSGRRGGNPTREDGAYVAGDNEAAQVVHVASILLLALLRSLIRHLPILLLLPFLLIIPPPQNLCF